MATKHGMADALRVVLTDNSERIQTRDRPAEAIDRLLTAGSRQGATRAHVRAQDVLLTLGGISLIADAEQQPELGAQLGLGLLLLLHGILTN